MKSLLRYFKRSLTLELKKTIIYPTSFWIIALVFPLASVIQIVFLETIYSQTNNFVGYTKYEAYVLFGTFTIVITLGHLFFYRRLAELKGLIRGDAQESFDIVLTKPIDAQIFATSGRFNFGNILPVLVGIFVVLYGLSHEPHLLGILNIFSYLAVIPMGILVYYIIYLFMSTFLFWFPEMQTTEALWESLQGFGQYPPGLYQGITGVIFNIIVPITLMAGVPVELLLGRMPLYMLLVYGVIISILFVLTRLFWNFSIKKYSSFSS